jgi:hypothetical protein
MNFAEKMLNYAKAAYPLIVINTHEEKRVTNDLYEALKTRENFGKFYFWDSVAGILARDDDKFNAPKDSDDATILLKWIEKGVTERKEKKCVYVLRDFHMELESRVKAKDYIRQIRNLANVLRLNANMIVFISPNFTIPIELEKEVQVVEYFLPDEQAIKNTLQDNIRATNQAVKSKGRENVVVTEEFITNVTEAAKGMTASEIDAAFSLASITTKGSFDKAYLDIVFEEKIQQIKKNSLLEYIEADISFDNVGALENVKEWILNRRKVFSPEAKKYGLKAPKAVLLAGIPGTGNILFTLF